MGDTINYEISIPTDNEGYVLLKCPLCNELFKLKPTDFQQDQIFEIYCPSCGLVSDNYFTDDVLDLAMTMAQNYANDVIAKEYKKLEQSPKGSLVKFKAISKTMREAEIPIMLVIESLVIKRYPCCKMEAKIKPILNMCGSCCPYCGVKDYGIE